jgi:FAD/FMN-containing dehydrogenase/Fe-S oxidoreductase
MKGGNHMADGVDTAASISRPSGGTRLPSARGRGAGGGGSEVSSSVDARALAADLARSIRGEVRFDHGSRALYSMDASNYRQAPIGVVIPRDTDDVVRTIALCRHYGAPVLPRGGGTSLAGQCCNVAVVIDMSKYLRDMIAIDPDRKLARVQPGVVLDDLRDQAERHHLTFGPDPATHNRCTLGGMIGNDSCGVHSIMAGRTEQNVAELEVVTYDGLRFRVGPTSAEDFARIQAEGGRRAEIYTRLRALGERYAPLVRERFPDIPRRVSGYNLNELLPGGDFNVARALVGSEGTCVTILEATLNLVHSPPARAIVVLGYPDVYRAADQAPRIMEHRPIGLEGFDERLVGDLRKKRLHPDGLALLPEGGGWLLVELGGESESEATDQARALMNDLGRGSGAPDMRLYTSKRDQKAIWEVRESGLGGTARTPGGPNTWPGWEDSATPPERFGAYLRDLRKLLDEYEYGGAFYGHFGQACLHTRIDFDLKSQPGIANFNAFMRRAAELVVGYGGSLSGEHGDGQARAELLPIMYGPELVQAFREFKAIWDPDWRMNPGKMVDAYRMDQNLRLGTDYNPPRLVTHFKFPEDHGSLADATLRCVGVGKCRRGGGETMCPSFMATREEKDSTRGRAHLLFEMFEGDVTPTTWRNHAVRDALDLCLACKGCKHDCPVNVDMATYKAEFLSHYYGWRPRPVTGYAMGWIYWWARAAAHAPRLVNAVTHAPVLGGAFKRLGGIAREREVPDFAPVTFKRWWRERAPRNVGRPQVILWPDTFNNHFHPATAVAAVEVLEDAGYQVVVPQADRSAQTLCCGRPLYDFGFLGMAERLLHAILEALRSELRAGLPIVVLEPSCCSVFRDDAINLFPTDEDAQRLAHQTFTLGEFLSRAGYEPRPLHRKALVHGHCHHKAIMGLDGEIGLFRRMGLDYDVLDDGCCGMAGAFGFERDHYDISLKVGERVLLPAVRTATVETLVVTDGFSCRTQIEQTTGRGALHVAEVLQWALRGDAGPGGASTESRGERAVVSALTTAGQPRRAIPPTGRWLVGTVILALAGVGGVVWRRGLRRASPIQAGRASWGPRA